MLHITEIAFALQLPVSLVWPRPNTSNFPTPSGASGTTRYVDQSLSRCELRQGPTYHLISPGSFLDLEEGDNVYLRNIG
jgi:hypothetical protein